MVVFDKFLIMKSIEESVLSFARIRPLNSITHDNFNFASASKPQAVKVDD